MQFNYKGAYSSSTNYVVSDVVSYQPTVNDSVKYYYCLAVNIGQTPIVGGDSSYWGVISALSNFPNSIDNFTYRSNIQGNDKVDIARINTLTLQTTLSSSEQDELNNLIAKHRNKLFLADDLNAIQDSLTNMQMFFNDKIISYINSSITSINTATTNGLGQLDTKLASINTYLDSTTAGALRTDLGVMADLTTTDQSSLVKALNETRSHAQLAKLTQDNGSILTSTNSDLNDYKIVGQYLIDGGVIFNKPTDFYFDGFLEVFVNGTNIFQRLTQSNGGTSNFGTQWWRTYTSSTSTWNAWVPTLLNIAPTWTYLTYQNGVSTYSTGTDVVFTRIGSVVYIKGAVTNISAANTIIGTLPASSSTQQNVRPLITHAITLPITNADATHSRSARWTFVTDGTIKLETTSDGIFTPTHWYPINTSFTVA